MKKLSWIFILVMGFAWTSCQKERIKYEHTATILGVDLALCACCGGYVVEVDEEVENGRFTFLPLETDVVLDHTTNYPLFVKLNYEETGACGDITYLEVIDIKLK